MISMISASTATPQNRISTTELVASMMHKLSPELINTICSLGVENRYSAMDNYADFLTGASMNPTSSTTELGVNATRKCIEEWGGDPSQIGLLIAATNTPDQMLPCLASEVMARTHGLLPRSLSTVSMQSQGCSVMLKSVEVAQWYLAANPGKMAVVLMSEAHTPYVAPLLRDEYHGFREIARMRKNGKINDSEFEQQRTETTLVIQSMLFGDGAVALLLGTDQAGKPLKAFPTLADIEAVEKALSDALELTQAINAWEGRWPLNTYADLDAGKLSEGARNRLKIAEATTQKQYSELLARRVAAREAYAKVAGRYDAFVTVGACGAASIGLGSTGNTAMNVAASLLGCPALTLPLLHDEGLPLGLQLLGATDRDAALFEVANWVARDAFDRADLVGAAG